MCTRAGQDAGIGVRRAPNTLQFMTFPPTRTVDHSDDFFGTAVPDPYRWLEDADSDEVRDWVLAQGDASQGYLDALPDRHAITDRLSALWNLPKSGVPRHPWQRVVEQHQRRRVAAGRLPGPRRADARGPGADRPQRADR